MESRISGYLSRCYARHNEESVALAWRAGLRIPERQSCSLPDDGIPQDQEKWEKPKQRTAKCVKNAMCSIDWIWPALRIISATAVQPESIDWVFAELDDGQNGVVCRVRASCSTAETIPSVRLITTP